jgi:hypothetical protein
MAGIAHSPERRVAAPRGPRSDLGVVARDVGALLTLVGGLMLRRACSAEPFGGFRRDIGSSIATGGVA